MGRGGGGAGSHFISPVGGGGRGRKEEGQETKGHPRIIRVAGRARQFTPGQTGLPIILCLGKTTFKPGSIPGDTGPKRLSFCILPIINIFKVPR